MESCYEIIPLLERYSTHQEMTDAELARVRIHLLECERCRAAAVPESRNSLIERWPEERVPAADLETTARLRLGALIGSLLLHAAAGALVVVLLNAFEDDSVRSWVLTQPLRGERVPLDSRRTTGGQPAFSTMDFATTDPAELYPTAPIRSTLGGGGLPGIESDRTREYRSILLPDLGSQPDIFVHPPGEVGAPHSTGAYATQTIEGSKDPLETVMDQSNLQEDQLVVWLIDRTPSMFARREQVLDRIRQWHETLEKKKKRQLRMTAIAFGERTKRLTFADTDNLANLLEAVERMEPEAGETENVAAALNQCARISAGTRRVSIILFTDERGDDLDDKALAATLAELKRHRIKLYVICDEIPLGVTQRVAAFGSRSMALTTGSESPQPEIFCDWHQAIPVPSLAPGRILSGFGPYELSLLATESKGSLYLNHVSPDYNLEDLNHRKPALIARSTYAKEIRDKPLRAMVLRTVATLRGISFPRRTVLRTQAERLDETAQTRAALEAVERLLPPVHEALAAYLAEEKHPRWRANARLIAAQLTAADYYLNRRLELLAGADPIGPGGSLTFSITDDIAVGTGPLTAAAGKLRGYGGTPWTLIGRELGNVKTLTLHAE